MKYSFVYLIASLTVLACSSSATVAPTVVSSANAYVRIALVSVVDDKGHELTAQFGHVDLFTTLSTLTYADKHVGYGNPAYAVNTTADGNVRLQNGSSFRVELPMLRSFTCSSLQSCAASPVTSITT